MKNAIGTGSALERLRKFIPASVQPKFNSVAEWQAWQQEEGRKHCQQIDKQNQRARSEKIFGRAGIRRTGYREESSGGGNRQPPAGSRALCSGGDHP